MSSSDVSLRWEGRDLVFRGGVPGGPQIHLDSDGADGPSPMRALMLSLAGCMAIDVKMILDKSRVPVTALAVDVSGTRAEEPPRRFTSLVLTYRIEGPGEEHEAKLQRAVDLSRDTYCSVLHTLRGDLDLEIRIERV